GSMGNVPLRRWQIVTVCVTSAAIFIPLFHRIMRNQYDYYFHIDAALQLLHGQLIVPHPLFEGLVAGLHQLGLNEWTAAMLACAAACIASAIIFFLALDHVVDERGPVLVFMALSLVLVNAPALFAIND